MSAGRIPPCRPERSPLLARSLDDGGPLGGSAANEAEIASIPRKRTRAGRLTREWGATAAALGSALWARRRLGHIQPAMPRVSSSVGFETRASVGATTAAGTGEGRDSLAPWRGRPRNAPRRHLHLVLLWYFREPARAGEVALLSGRAQLGRDAGAPGALEWVRQRPGRNLPQPPLSDPRMSRRQLELEPSGNEVAVRNLGRRRLLCNGVVRETAMLAEGDRMALEDLALFAVESRPEALPRSLHASADSESFDFGGPDACGLLGESEVAWRFRHLLSGVARAPGHVLLYGPSGSGKELAARTVHELSARRAGPLLARNAATIPEALIDAELFGNAKNYPNPGMPERAGLVGEADGGTLLLDEIGELSEAHQAHLLRVLDASGEYQRLGEARVRRSDFRMLGITNRALESLKHDFLARFATRVELPGLNCRRVDVPLVLRHAFREALRSDPERARRFAVPGRGEEPLIEPRLIEALVSHSYSHNFRELVSAFRLSLRTSPGAYLALTPALAAELSPAPSPELTARTIERALRHSGGRAGEAARLLGLSNRFALYRQMKKHGVENPGRSE